MSLIVASLNSTVVSQTQGTGTAASAGRGDAAQSRGQASQATARQAQAQLTPEQQLEVAKLKQIDQDVHTHEAAHLAAAQGLATSGATYTYVYGPDGKRYAIGGEVSIDTSAESKPQANIDKGRRIRTAAMAPADPSAQDFQVASAGDQLVTLGRAELAAQQRQQRADNTTANSAGQKIARTYASAGTVSSGNSISLYA
jgi:hypothetical protein